MNKIAPLIFFLFVMFISGCKKATSDTLVKPFVKGMRFKQSDKIFTVGNVSISDSTLWGGQYIYLITQSDGDLCPKLGFKLKSFSVGVHSLDTSNYTYSWYQGKMHRSLYGTLNITQMGQYITGTFSFTCSDSLKISEGQFNLPNP